jgi:hypothetical protein
MRLDDDDRLADMLSQAGQKIGLGRFNQPGDPERLSAFVNISKKPLEFSGPLEKI